MKDTKDLVDFASVEELASDMRAGRMFVLVDAEDRENEGDLVVAAEKADAEAISFMARYGRGLVCLALTRERVAELDLERMGGEKIVTGRRTTAFTVSVEAREGVTTGISAHDRARTIEAASNPRYGKGDISTPGHVFPIEARDGGVLVRAGHTEAAVDFARLAGLRPAAVICEIMRDDGKMARLPDLGSYAREHGLKVGKISDLIAHRRRTDRLVNRILEKEVETRHGVFLMVEYEDAVRGGRHVAFVKGLGAEGGGDIEPPLVRVQAMGMTEAMLGTVGYGRASAADAAMAATSREGRGAVVLLCRGEGLLGADPGDPLLETGIGAQIVRDLGIRKMRALGTPRKIGGLEGYGLEITTWEEL